MLGTSGDNHLGGEDFDHHVVEYCINLPENDGIEFTAKAKVKLRRAVENAKKILSAAQSTDIDIEGLIDGEDFSHTLSRAKFEEINKKDFDKLIPIVEICLKDAGKSKSDVSKICLVGGSTRIPKVQRIVENWIGDPKKVDKTLNPDEAIAEGAAWLAASISKQCPDTIL